MSGSFVGKPGAQAEQDELSKAQSSEATVGAVVAGLIILTVTAFFIASIAVVGRRWLKRDESASSARAVTPSLHMAVPARPNPSPTTRHAVVVVPPGHTTGVVRRGPGMSSVRLVELPAGTSVEILDEAPAVESTGTYTWYRVRAGRVEGWMHENILRLE